MKTILTPTYKQLTTNIDFINKRIDEQLECLIELNNKVIKKILIVDRYIELFQSALSQLQYFENLKKNYYGTIRNTINYTKCN